MMGPLRVFPSLFVNSLLPIVRIGYGHHGRTSRRDPDEIKADVKNNLARYKVPRDVVFLHEFPRNATVMLLPTQLADIEIDT